MIDKSVIAQNRRIEEYLIRIQIISEDYMASHEDQYKDWKLQSVSLNDQNNTTLFRYCEINDEYGEFEKIYNIGNIVNHVEEIIKANY
ncbi:hypothetical protein ACFQZR_23140 [Paenibacillus sp. GCM10027629]|uniref:hypothetical protein n=1 Tax=Paenibacillus sp. GCM10027629 TaxID=3273414 RepID=UPI0036364F54